MSGPAAQERMASFGEMLSAQTRAAYAAAAAYAGAGRSKARRRAAIAGMRQIAMVNFDLLMEFELTVLPAGTPPYPATTQQLVSPWQARQMRQARAKAAPSSYAVRITASCGSRSRPG